MVISMIPHQVIRCMIGGLLLLTGTWATAADLRVVASIKPIHSILSALMAGAAAPALLINGTDTPYNYRPTTDQIELLKNADLVVWVGPELESTLEAPLKENVKQTRLVELLAHPELKILPSRWDENRRDPYFWMDTRNALILLHDLTRTLMQIDPERTHLYRQNHREMNAKLAQLDRELEYGYRGLKGGAGLVYYDTLQYFEQAYALKVSTALTSGPNRPVDTAALLRARSNLSDNRYACLLTEAGLPARQLPLLRGHSETKTAQIDSLGTQLQAGSGLYLELMRINTDVIKNCLDKDEMAAPATDLLATSEPPSTAGGKFLLVDHNGGLVSEQDLLGKYQLIYFGYTYCPDVCPTSLQTMSIVLDMLKDKAALIQPYMITVDPQRDTAEVLAKYISYFNPRIIGLTGTQAMIDQVTQQFKVIYEKVIDDANDPELYLMDHTASLYLMAPDGKFITKFAYGISTEQVLGQLEAILPR